MSEEKVSGILQRAKRLMEAQHKFSPDDAIWAICRNESTRIESNRLFYKAKAYVEQAGDFPNAIALAEKEEAK
jgi:hypothetical protein